MSKKRGGNVRIVCIPINIQSVTEAIEKIPCTSIYQQYLTIKLSHSFLLQSVYLDLHYHTYNKFLTTILHMINKNEELVNKLWIEG